MTKEKLKKVSNIMLIVSVFNILWFTITAIVLQFKTGVELSSTLITFWYTFWTAEVFSIAGIKITKVIHPDIELEEVENELVG